MQNVNKVFSIFGSSTKELDSIVEGDGFEQFANAGLIPHGGFNAPLYAMWELTSACPNKCMYCYNDSHAQRNCELSSKRKFEIADELIGEGIFQICLTGGEPLACNQYLDLLRYFTTHGVQVGSIFSGALMTQKVFEQVCQYLKMVQISLDGSTKEIHDKVRGRSGSYDEAISAIKRFVRRGITVKVSFATTKYNIDDFENTYNLCKELGVNSIRTQKLAVSGRVKGKEEEIYPSDSQIQKYEQFIYSRKGGMLIEYRSPAEHVQFGIKNGYSTIARINSEGMVGLTPYIDVYFGDLKKESFGEIWNRMKMGWHNPEMLELAKQMDQRGNGTLVDPVKGATLI